MNNFVVAMIDKCLYCRLVSAPIENDSKGGVIVAVSFVDQPPFAIYPTDEAKVEINRKDPNVFPIEDIPEAGDLEF